MVAIVKRMRHMHSLLSIRTGPGAAVLPSEVTRLHLDFAALSQDGHMGPRRFWQKCLPRLKYHNPATTMTVNRRKTSGGPAVLTIHFTSPDHADDKNAISSTTQAASSTAPVAGTVSGPSTVRTETINMKNRTDSDILRELLQITKARELEPSEADIALMAELEEARVKGERDSARHAQENEARRKKAAVLAAARGDPVTAAEA